MVTLAGAKSVRLSLETESNDVKTSRILGIIMLILLGIGACLMSHGFCSIDVQVIIPTTVEDDFLLSAEALEEHLTEKTRVLS